MQNLHHESQMQISESVYSGYGPRTKQNAGASDLTIAIAINYETSGEMLTRRSAGERYFALPLTGETKDPVVAARALYRYLRDHNLTRPTLNIAGNGLHTLSRHGWSQEQIDWHVYLILQKVHEHWPIGKIISGGQTGSDIAGLVAARALGIDAIGTMPQGFRRRDASGVDFQSTEQQVRQDIENGARSILAWKEAKTPDSKPLPIGKIRIGNKRDGGAKPNEGEIVIHGDRLNPVFGNPYILKYHRNPDERRDVISRHLIEIFEPDILNDGQIYLEMSSIAKRMQTGENFILMCWCAPRPCHCDHIADGIRKLADGVNLRDEIARQIADRSDRAKAAGQADPQSQNLGLPFG